MSELRDIVFFMLDDVGFTDLLPGLYPAVDSLRLRGVECTAAFAHPSCAVTRDTLFRSKWVGLSHGPTCAASTNPIALNALKLPKMLREAKGYRTACFGKWHLGAQPAPAPWQQSPIAYGYDVWRAGMPSNSGDCGGASHLSWFRVDADAQGFTEGLSAQFDDAAIGAEFRTWWQATPSPKFAMVAFQGAHARHDVPPAGFLRPGTIVPPVTSIRQRFLLQINAVDWQIEQCLALVAPEAWVFLAGDNGTPPNCAGPGQDPNKLKGTTFDGGIHVPFIIAGSDVSVPGTASDALVHFVDVVASLADGLGIFIGPGIIDGETFAPILVGGSGLPRDWIFSGDPTDRCIRKKDWKYRCANGVEELYDLELDPYETINVNNDPLNAAILAELRSRFQVVTGGAC